MAFIPLFSGVVLPHGSYNSVTLMEYINNHKKAGHTARKYCYIVKCNDLQTIFNNAGILLPEERGKNTNSYWNRRPINENMEYAVEICQDDIPNACKDPVYIVYDKQWKSGKKASVITQHKIFTGKISPNEAITLDQELRKYDINP